MMFLIIYPVDMMFLIIYPVYDVPHHLTDWPLETEGYAAARLFLFGLVEEGYGLGLLFSAGVAAEAEEGLGTGMLPSSCPSWPSGGGEQPISVLSLCQTERYGILLIYFSVNVGAAVDMEFSASARSESGLEE